MPATCFSCPDGKSILFAQCLQTCRLQYRCMFLSTLQKLAQLNQHRKPFSVTELLCGTREAYLKRITNYAISPQEEANALVGTAVHQLHEQINPTQNILTEQRLHGTLFHGQFDCYGALLDEQHTLGDFKVTSSYKLSRALGFYKKEIPTSEVFKTGPRKGAFKTVKEWRYDGVRHQKDWAIQLNAYRMLLEQEGHSVSDMVIQAFCRDNGLKAATERNLQQAIYLLPIRRISNRWLTRYFQAKRQTLESALATKTLPPVCRSKERWGDRKCLGYCAVAATCPYALQLRNKKQAEKESA